MKKRAWFTAAIAAVLTWTAGAQTARFTLAIVRFDGRLVPFAAYGDGRWDRAWPEADEGTVGIPTFDSTASVWGRRGERIPEIWQVWPWSAASRIEAHVKGVEIVTTHCQKQVALATDLQAVKQEHPRKFGVAVDSTLAIGPIEEVRRSDALWRDVERTVAARFSMLEAAQARADRQQLPVETPAPVARITALFREAQSPRSPMYFVAEKTYRTDRSPHDRGCKATTIVTGWLVPADAGTMALRDPSVFLTDCDAKVARRAVPLAALRISNQVFWVLQQLAYESETYVIAEIGPADVRYPIQVAGGGC